MLDSRGCAYKQQYDCPTYMSSLTGAKNAFSPSSVVVYARFPAKTWGGGRECECARATSIGRITHLEAWCLVNNLLRNRRHAVLGDRGGGGVRHGERGTGGD